MVPALYGEKMSYGGTLSRRAACESSFQDDGYHSESWATWFWRHGPGRPSDQSPRAGPGRPNSAHMVEGETGYAIEKNKKQPEEAEQPESTEEAWRREYRGCPARR